MRQDFLFVLRQRPDGCGLNSQRVTKEFCNDSIATTDLGIKTLHRQARTAEEEVPDGSVAGLFLRLSPAGSSAWTQIIRVTGEGGINAHGKALLGKRHRLTLGQYPAITIEVARIQSNIYLEQAKRGINPKDALKAAATAGTRTVADLSVVFMAEYVKSRELDSVALAYSLS